jgi:hypothetical protein
MDFSKVKVNCSMLGVVMAEPKGMLTDAMFETLEKLKAKEELTDKQELQRIELQFRMDNYDPKKLSGGCMKYLLFLYCYYKYGPQFRPLGNGGVVGMEKGKKSERSSFEMVKRVTGREIYRSKGNIKNKYLKGRMDLINAPTLELADTVIDIKGHHGWMDFMPSIAKEEIERRDNFQLQGYMGITDKYFGEVFRVLSDFTEEDIEKQKDKLVRQLCPDGIITEEFEEEWFMTENAMRFANIPEEERITYFKTERDEKIIEKIYEKVEFCREWLADFEIKHANKVAGQRLIWQTLTS